jgi:predicted nucleotidyltransferase
VSAAFGSGFSVALNLGRAYASSDINTETLIENVTVERLCAAHPAILLYGSCARGDSRPGSDIDLLIVGELSMPIPREKKLSVTAYAPSHLLAMARHGSLFVLHLREEARIMVDRQDIIPPILGAWKTPDYDRLFDGLRAAASVLDVPPGQVKTAIVRRAALFVLRSVLYAECARRGTPTFGMSSVATFLGDSRIWELFEDVHWAGDIEVVTKAMALLDTYLGGRQRNPFGGLEPLAVNYHKRYPMASYLAVDLLTDGVGINYASAPADWVAE